MNKLLRILKARRGMTMVEVLAGMLLFTILATSVTAVFLPILRMYNQANELAEVNALLDNLSNEMVNTFSMADSSSSISVNDGAITVITYFGKTVYEVDDGLLCRTGAPVLEKGYYKGKTVGIEYLDADEVEFSPDYGAVTEPFYIKLSVLGKDGFVLASRRYAVNPFGLRDYSISPPDE